MTKSNLVIVRADGSMLVALGPEFDATEASYVRAAAGNMVSGASVTPVGITSSGGVRWLLHGDRPGKITISRHETKHELDPYQVLKAFRMAGREAEVLLVQPQGKHAGYRTPYVERTKNEIDSADQ